MAVLRKKEQESEEAPKRNPNIEKVADRVMNKLGTPAGFLKVKCVHLFENKYRVNVYQRIFDEFQNLIIKNKICDSFFVIADENGEIVSPKIEKRY